jgi:cytochrome c oxidase assembly protein subunit 15
VDGRRTIDTCRRHYLAAGTLACTLFLIFWGGLVTSTGSALSVPDWPLSYGMIQPPLVGGIFYEHIHRQIAAGVGFLTLVLAFWTSRREERRGVRRLAWVALAAVCTQGGLGAITVLFFTPLPVSAAHACLAQTFLCLVVALTYATSHEGTVPAARREDATGLRTAAIALVAGVFVQLVLGAIMRHIDRGQAALAIPDFPLALGQVIPPLDSGPVAIHFAHRVGALVVLVLVGNLVLRAFRSRDARFTRPALGLVALVLVQVTLGAFTVWTAKAVYPTCAHVANGAAVLATGFFLTLRAFRLTSAVEPAGAPSAVPESV